MKIKAPEMDPPVGGFDPLELKIALVQSRLKPGLLWLLKKTKPPDIFEIAVKINGGFG